MRHIRFFVYGIFLGEYSREKYGMINPRYATVRGFVTVGVNAQGTIVEAKKAPSDMVLTGLVVDVPVKVQTPYGELDNIDRLDRMEAGYNRITITTTDGDKCQMYVKQ